MNSDIDQKPSNSQLLKFFLPLAFQAMTIALSYPLVAMVAAKGEGGPLNLAGLAQSNTVMLFIAMISSGFFISGLVYAKTANGFTKFKKALFIIGSIIIAIHLFLMIPSVSHILFSKFMGLSPAMEKPAIIAFRYSLVMQLLFLIRLPDTIAMYNAKVTGKVSLTTIGRIIVTLILSTIFVKQNMVGIEWAMICFSVPLIIEVIMSKILARPYIKELYKNKEQEENKETVKEIIEFSLPLSTGGMFLTLADMMLAAIISRVASSETMLPVYYAVAGILAPISFAARRFQAVTITFIPYFKNNSFFILRFVIVVGFTSGLLLLFFLVPSLLEMFFINIQNLPISSTHLIKLTIFASCLIPLAISYKSYQEGLAAYHKKPVTVLAGNAVFLGITVASAFIAQTMGLVGVLIGPLAIMLGNLTAAGTISMAMRWEYKSELPISNPNL